MGQVACKRGVYSPPGACSCFYCGRRQEEKERGREESEAYIIYTGESYIGGPNHEGNKSVSEPANYDWYHYEEDYYKSVSGNDYIIDLVIP